MCSDPVILVFPLTPSQDIKDVMRKAGEVTFADINRDRDGQG